MIINNPDYSAATVYSVLQRKIAGMARAAAELRGVPESNNYQREMDYIEIVHLKLTIEFLLQNVEESVRKTLIGMYL